MSLINKMLQDLEARQETAPTAGTRVYQNLRPVNEDRNRILRPLSVAVAGILVLAAALYVASERMGISLGLVPAAKIAELGPAPSGPAQPHRPPPAAGTPPAAAVPSSPKAEVPASPSVTPPVKDTIVAKPIPAPAVTARAPAAPASPSPVVSSQKNADVSIVKPKETTPAPVHKGERKPVETRAPRRDVAAASTAERPAVVDKKVRPLTAEQKAEAGYRRAVRFLDQSRPEDAMRQLRDVLAEQPRHVKARELAAAVALQTGHWREAQALLEEGLRQVPNHYLFARLLARVYLDHGAETKALAVLESALPAGSDDAEFSALLALLYQRAGRHPDAVKVYERALTLNAADGRTWLGFAISLEAIEQWGAAKNAYSRAQHAGLVPTLARYAEQRLAALKDR